MSKNEVRKQAEHSQKGLIVMGQPFRSRESKTKEKTTYKHTASKNPVRVYVVLEI